MSFQRIVIITVSFQSQTPIKYNTVAPTPTKYPFFRGEIVFFFTKWNVYLESSSLCINKCNASSNEGFCSQFDIVQSIPFWKTRRTFLDYFKSVASTSSLRTMHLSALLWLLNSDGMTGENCVNCTLGKMQQIDSLHWSFRKLLIKQHS